VVLVIDDLETANALRDALDDEVAGHELAADSWTAIARRLTPRAPWRRTVTRLAPAATALVIAAAVVVVMIIDRPGGSGPISRPLGLRDAGSSWLKKDAVLNFTGKSHGILPGAAAGYGAIWVGGDGATYRVDPSTDRVVDRISTSKVGQFSQFAAGLGSVWVSGSNLNGTDLCVYRIDPRNDQITAVISLPGGGSPATLAAAYGFVWVTSRTQHGSVLRIDPRTNRVVGQPIQVSNGRYELGNLEAGFGQIWVNSVSANVPETAINAVTGTVVRRTSPSWATITNVSALGDGSIWTIFNTGIRRIDPATGKVTATIPLLQVNQVVFVHGVAIAIKFPASVLGAGLNAHAIDPGMLTLIDPATNRITGTPVRLGGLPAFFATAPDGLWITDLTKRTLTHYAVTAPRA
jgi:hypothetical protein